MRDFAIYVTLRNKTGESFTDGTSVATHGRWDNFPSSISPNSSSSFELRDIAWFTGSQGTFSYKIRDAERHTRAEMYMSQTNPYIGKNEVSYVPPKPMALYTCSFRARVGNGGWTDSYVEESGHPVNVEYTIQYQHRPFRFQVNEITATSKHPVRNSRKELSIPSGTDQIHRSIRTGIAAHFSLTFLHTHSVQESLKLASWT